MADRALCLRSPITPEKVLAGKITPVSLDWQELGKTETFTLIEVVGHEVIDFWVSNSDVDKPEPLEGRPASTEFVARWKKLDVRLDVPADATAPVVFTICFENGTVLPISIPVEKPQAPRARREFTPLPPKMRITDYSPKPLHIGEQLLIAVENLPGDYEGESFSLTADKVGYRFYFESRNGNELTFDTELPENQAGNVELVLRNGTNESEPFTVKIKTQLRSADEPDPIPTVIKPPVPKPNKLDPSMEILKRGQTTLIEVTGTDLQDCVGRLTCDGARVLTSTASAEGKSLILSISVDWNSPVIADLDIGRPEFEQWSSVRIGFAGWKRSSIWLIWSILAVIVGLPALLFLPEIDLPLMDSSIWAKPLIILIGTMVLAFGIRFLINSRRKYQSEDAKPDETESDAKAESSDSKDDIELDAILRPRKKVWQKWIWIVAIAILACVLIWYAVSLILDTYHVIYS